ncbi:MAG: hypothetical protein Q8L52_01535 [bacterium]|nr:hypothetical protein [bacterium]
MKTVFEHIKHIKGKPHHIRKRIAFATAACGTAIIAFVWLAGSISTGAFAIKTTSFTDINKPAGVETVTDEVGGPYPVNSEIAGVAGALQTVNGPARIEIVDTTSSTRSTKKAEQTTIPF